MKFLQVHSFYDKYLAEFYGLNRNLLTAPFDIQIKALIDDSFSGSHLFAPYLGEHGYDSKLIIANCQPTQAAWCKENNFFDFNSTHWLYQILKYQIDTIKPDVLYLSHPIDFDTSFVRALSWKPKVVFGWRAANIPAHTDFSAFDAILSSIPACREKALQHGAKSVQHFTPGFCEFVVDRVKDINPDFDVVFSGQWTPEHQRRNEQLTAVADLAHRSQSMSLGYFLLAYNPEALPEPVKKVNHGEKWAIEMYRALRRGRIVINGLIDLAQGNGGNMREFETTGVGSFLLTEAHPTLNTYFTPGTEVETFQSTGELLEKIRYYLENSAERESIAKKGQERCLKDHSMKVRAQQFAEIVRGLLAR